MNNEKKLWFSTHPRETVQFLVFVLFSVWQIPVALFGFLFFIILTRVVKFSWKLMLGSGVWMGLVGIFCIEYQGYFQVGLKAFIRSGFYLQAYLLEKTINKEFSSFFLYYGVLIRNVVCFSPMVAGLLAVCDLIPNSAYERSLKLLHKAKNIASKEVGDPNKLKKALSMLKDECFDGTLLGVSKITLKPFVVPDKVLNQILLVLGTTGGGKTVTLRRFYKRAILNGYPLIIVDGKPTQENEVWVKELAKRYDRKFYGFNCGGYQHYDCLAYGGYTELKDKIICLKDQWESDYYKTVAEDYLQTTFEVLLKSKTLFDLKTVIDCLDFHELALKVREIGDAQLMARVKKLDGYDKKDIKGLQAHLNLLVHSELGEYLEKGADNTFNLKEVIENNDVVYFALPALRFPSFSKVLGKLVINDIKTVIDRDHNKKIFAIFDEFSVFASGQALNLANMGRGKGLHAIFGTQGVADLEAIDKAFSEQVLNCVNTIISHRLNGTGDAEAITAWVGTKDAFVVTAQISDQGHSGVGSVHRSKEFIIHPDAIKQQLNEGEAFYITKVDGFFQDKIKVKYS